MALVMQIDKHVEAFIRCKDYRGPNAIGRYGMQGLKPLFFVDLTISPADDSKPTAPYLQHF